MTRSTQEADAPALPNAVLEKAGMGMRRTGIEVVGDAPWGTHFCQFYATKDDLADILVPYFKAGLESDEFCMWVTSPPLGVDEAWSALERAVPDLESYRRRGRIEIIPHTDWYLLGGSFEQDRVLKGWVAKLEDALARGCSGLRLTGNTFWLEKSGWRSFADYEAVVDGVIGQYRMLALCTYAVDRCGAMEVADVVRNHQFALIKRDGRWDLFESFDRRRMQDALAVERERLAVTLQSIGDAVIATDTEGRVAMLNQVAQELTGWSQAEASGRSVREVFRIVDEDSGRPAEDPVGRVLQAGVAVDLANHTALVARDGRQVSIADSAAPIRGRGGESLGVVLVFRDVTATRLAEQRSRRQNAVLAGIARILQEALTCQTEEDLGRVCLSVAEEVTQSKFAFIAEINGQSGKLDDIAISDPGWEACRMQEQRGHGNRIPFGFEIRGIYGRVLLDGKGFFTNDPPSHPDSVGIPVGHPPLKAFLGVPLLHAGKTIGMIGFANREGGYGPEELDAAGALAVGIVQALLRKRAEEKLRAANAELTESDRRKNEFLGMLSHELRNPLAPIRNSIYILDHAAPTGEQARRAKEVIKRQAEHLTRLVDDLLDVTRIARGKIELKRSRIDLSVLMRRAGEDHGTLMRQRGIKLTVEVPREPIWADGDSTRLSQVVGNLLHNSAKFTAPGGEVRLALEVAKGAAEIHVRDTGVGIEPDLLARVFEPFVQGERTIARTDGGLGLGLALVKGITGLHGGSVRAASAGPGQGAEFVVRLPLVEAGTTQGAALPRAAGMEASRRVLVVDDNEDAAESLAELVEMFGHTAEVAYDGPSAIAKARASPPDVIFCDIGLPDMSGYEVIRALRNDGALRRTQMFAVSGYAQPEDRKKAADAGFDGFVAKPSDPDEIERLLA